MRRTREARLVIAVLLVMLASPCTAASYSYGFESGTLEGWTADATDQGQCAWHITASSKLPYAGAWSLEYYMNNINDATKIWIERAYDVQAGRRYDVGLTWKLATKDSPVTACPIIVYVGGHDLETHDDDIQVIGYSIGGGTGNWVWLSESYLRTGVLPGAGSGTAQGKIWVAIGMWGTFEVSFTWYVDNVTVDITESQPPVSIGQARQASDTARVFVQGKMAATGWSDLKSPDSIIRRIYVEEPNRSAGAMVKHYRTFQGDPVRGDVLDVSGVMATEDGERVVKNATISWSGSVSGAAVKPLCASNASIGGGPFGPYVTGVAGSTGLNNSGLLVRSFGRVVYGGAGYFVIDDGSREFSCGKSAVRGLAVSTADAFGGVTAPPDGSYVAVTGLSGVFSSSNLYYPVIRLRSSNDITQFAPWAAPAGSSLLP
jgi:hypothetical protein